MSNEVNANGNELQIFIGQSKLNGAEDLPLSRLTSVIVDLFNDDDSSHEDLILAGKLANEAGILRRKAIWAAFCNDSPSKLSMNKGEFYLTFFGLEASQSSKEISRARIQNLLLSETEWVDLNDSCLDLLNSYYRNHGERFIFSVYEECNRRVEFKEKLRITRPLITEVSESIACSATVSSNSPCLSNGLAGIEPKENTVLVKATAAKLDNIDTVKVAYNSKASSKQRSKLRRKRVVGPRKSKRLLKQKIYQKSLLDTHQKEESLDHLLIDARQNEASLNLELENLADDLNNAEEKVNDLDIKYSDLLMICNWFADLLSNVESDLRELSTRTPQLSEIIEELVTIKGEFLEDIDNPVTGC
jgi:hypothetical protein